MFTASTSASNPFAVYVVGEFGDGFQGNVTLTLTRRDNGTYKGTLRGMAAYPDQNAEDDFSDAPLDVVFLAGPVGDEDETFQCF